MNIVTIGKDVSIPGAGNRQPVVVRPTQQSAKIDAQISSQKLLLKHSPTMAHLKGFRTGLATWYGKVLDRHRTASGEIFDSSALTGASNTLPFGTRVEVTNLRNGRSVVVRVNDRGILAPGNIIDLSSAAADKIGLLKMGIAPVRLEIVI